MSTDSTEIMLKQDLQKKVFLYVSFVTLKRVNKVTSNSYNHT